MGGDSQLGNNLSIGIDSCAKAWPEGEITVLSEEAVAGRNGAHCSQAKTSAGVREALVRIGIHCGNEGTEASKDLLLLGTGHGNNHGRDDEKGWWDEAEVFHFVGKVVVGVGLEEEGGSVPVERWAFLQSSAVRTLVAAP